MNVLKSRERHRSHNRHSVKSVLDFADISEVNPIFREQFILIKFASQGWVFTAK